jgi:hypothetical protein
MTRGTDVRNCVNTVLAEYWPAVEDVAQARRGIVISTTTSSTRRQRTRGM